MTLFLITRTDSVDYDEYDEVLVRASTAEAAAQMIHDDSTYAGSFRRRQYNIQAVSPDGEPAVIIDSFCAG